MDSAFNLPSGIWQVIVESLNLKHCYQVSLASKAIWVYIRHLPFEGSWNVRSSETVVPSFMLAKARHAKVIFKTPTNFSNLQRLLGSFHYLESVTLYNAASEITVKTASRSLLCLAKKISAWQADCICRRFWSRSVWWGIERTQALANQLEKVNQMHKC